MPLDRLRDRVLFETAHVRGARASEVCGLQVDDLDLLLDDEHARIHGKGGTVRAVLLDDRATSPCSAFTTSPAPATPTGQCFGPASTVPAGHCPTTPTIAGAPAAAGVSIGIHQLRHAHATELINSGVSIEAVLRRLGHASTETTQIYTLLADNIGDHGIRAARRRRGTRR